MAIPLHTGLRPRQSLGPSAAAAPPREEVPPYPRAQSSGPRKVPGFPQGPAGGSLQRVRGAPELLAIFR